MYVPTSDAWYEISVNMNSNPTDDPPAGEDVYGIYGKSAAETARQVTTVFGRSIGLTSGPGTTVVASTNASRIEPQVTSSLADATVPSNGQSADLITCSNKVILVMNGTGLEGAIFQDPLGTLAYYPGAKPGTYGPGCVDPGTKVIYYGPFQTQREAWDKRGSLSQGRATVVLLSVDGTANEPGGICELAQTATPPTLSTDPTAGIISGPWVFELTNILIRHSFLGYSESNNTRLSPTIIHAIEQYQATLGVVPDGEVGPKTWAKILSANCGE